MSLLNQEFDQILAESYGQYCVKDAKDFMMLGVGQPSPQILQDALPFIEYKINDYNVLQYGLKQGFESYRKLVYKLLKDYTNTEIDTNRIYMTNGISQAIFMLGSLLKNNLGYDTIYVEDLTYFIMINIFKDIGYKIKSFNLSNLDKLKEELKRDKNSIIYLIPFCNNPTGLTMTQNQLDNFLKCLQNNTIVLSDETYQFLHYTNNPDDLISNKPLAYYNSNIISLGTFSKILAPGVRLGWIYSDYKINNINFTNISLNDYLDNTGFMDSCGSVNPIMAYMITNNINNNYQLYQEFLNKTIKDLEKKSNFIINIFEKYSNYFEIIKPNGGYFIFVKAKKIKSSLLWKLATEKSQFGFHEGNKFSIDKNHNYYFRLSVSYYSFEDFERFFEERLQILIGLIDSYQYEISIFGNGKLGKLIKENLNNYGLIDRSFNRCDFGEVIVDVTSPEGTIMLINKILEYNLKPKLIIGTTGHTFEQLEKIKIYSKIATVVYCANFSNGIQNIIKIIRNLTFEVKDINIIDIHHIHKKDSPSGTAKLLKYELQNIYNNINIELYSQREGTTIGYHKIILKGENEIITIEHDAKSRNIFSKGCISLIEKIKNKENGYYEYLD